MRAGYVLAEAPDLAGSPGDAGSPDVAVVTAGPADGDLDRLLMPISGGPWRNVPTIVLLPAGSSEAAGRALAQGAVDVMVAPVYLPELNSRLAVRLRGVRDGFLAAASHNGQAQLFSVFRDLALASRPEETLQILAREVARSLDAAHCAVIFSLDSGRGRVIAVAERPDVRNLEIDLADYPEAQHAAATGQTTFIPEASQHPLFGGRERNPTSGPNEPTSAVAVPIVFQGKSLGFFVVRTALPRPNLTADGVAFIETLVVNATRLLEHEDRRATLYRRQAGAGLTEPVTGCGGLDALDRRVREEMHRAERYGRRFTLMLLDIDGLRFVNDRHGVAAGDRVLSGVGGVLHRELRSPDFVARYGGDEFAVIMPETGEAGALDTLTRLRRAIASQPAGMGQPEPVALSAGFVSYPGPGILTSEDLFAKAEAALQARKDAASDAAA